MTIPTATEYLAELRELYPDDEKKKLVARLTLADYPAKDIGELFPKEPKKASFRDEYYDYLVENTPTEDEAEAWIKASDLLTPNIEKHLSAFKRDAALVLRVVEAVS